MKVDESKIMVNGQIFEFAEIKNHFFKNKKCNHCGTQESQSGTKNLLNHLSACGFEIRGKNFLKLNLDHFLK